MRRAICLLALLACNESASPPPQPAPTPAQTPRDAGVDGITVIRGFDPATGYHIDDDTNPRPTAPATGAREGRPIDITLRSTPTGAQAAVDGTVIGTTPTFWQGEANGREHEFTFVLPGHAVARYRFVPVTSGVVHARLSIIHFDNDAGVAMPPTVPQQQVAPPKVVPEPAPVVVPDAALEGSAQIDRGVGPQP